jgi:hypothetical protein
MSFLLRIVIDARMDSKYKLAIDMTRSCSLNPSRPSLSEAFSSFMR